MRTIREACLVVAAFSALDCMPLQAQDAGFEPFAPRYLPPGKGGTVEESLPESNHQNDSGEVLVEKITGIVLLDTAARLREESTRQGVQTPGFQPPQEDALIVSLERYIGKPLTFGALGTLCQIIVSHYREQGFPIVDAIIPEGQDVSNGVVQVLVLEGKVDEVRVEGANYFSTDLLRSQIRLTQGDLIRRKALVADLEWLNSNPFRKVDLLFEPGDELGSTDLVLSTQDRMPLRVYTGIENTGVESTGENRLFTGFNYGNAFGLDQQWNGQFTSDSEFSRLLAWSSAYLIPLPTRHWLSFYGSYVESRPDNPAPFNQDGTNWELGASYRIPVFCSDTLRSEWSFGYVFKRIDNNLQFGGLEVFSSAVDISQFMAGYEGSYMADGSRSNWGAFLHFSPGGIGGHSEDADYELASPGADPTYAYLTARVGHEQELPMGLTWKFDVESQIATGSLIGSEQQGVGGFQSVRGYREYELTGDNALVMRNELRAPSMECFGRFTGLQDSLQPLLFMDLGTAWKYDPGPGEQKYATLASIGLGLRYAFDPRITAYLDWGIQLRDSGEDDPDSSAINFGITGSY